DGAQPCAKSGSARRLGRSLRTVADGPSRTIPAHWPFASCWARQRSLTRWIAPASAVLRSGDGMGRGMAEIDEPHTAAQRADPYPPAASVRKIAGVLTDRSGRCDVARALPPNAGGRHGARPPGGRIIPRVPLDVALSDALTVCGDRDDRRPPEPVP